MDLRDRFIELIGESRFSELKAMIEKGYHIGLHQCLSNVLTLKNGGENIKLKLESLCVKCKFAEPLDDN